MRTRLRQGNAGGTRRAVARGCFPMANVVITGSTRGIGLGLAKEFRRLGHSVVVSSRGSAAVAAAVAEVSAAPGSGTVVGQPCDVGQRDQVQALWDAAAAGLGGVDIWINNAGLAGPKLNLPLLDPGRYRAGDRNQCVGDDLGHASAAGRHDRARQRQDFQLRRLRLGWHDRAGADDLWLDQSCTDLFHQEHEQGNQRLACPARHDQPGDRRHRSARGDRKTPIRLPGRRPRSSTIFWPTGSKRWRPILLPKCSRPNKPGAAIRWLTTPKAAWRFMSAGITKRKVMPD